MFYTTHMLGKGAKNALSVLLYKDPPPLLTDIHLGVPMQV